MPRRKKPFRQVAVGDSVSSMDHAELVRLIRDFLNSHPATRQCDNVVSDNMSHIIADAYQSAKLGLDTLLKGKRVKPDAWKLDIFCSDIAQAWKVAELTPKAWEEGSNRSSFIQFLNDLTELLSLKSGRGSLVNNAKRAEKIERSIKRSSSIRDF